MKIKEAKREQEPEPVVCSLCGTEIKESGYSILADFIMSVIGSLKTAGVVKEKNFLLTWVGPEKVSNN